MKTISIIITFHPSHITGSSCQLTQTPCRKKQILVEISLFRDQFCSVQGLHRCPLLTNSPVELILHLTLTRLVQHPSDSWPHLEQRSLLTQKETIHYVQVPLSHTSRCSLLSQDYGMKIYWVKLFKWIEKYPSIFLRVWGDHLFAQIWSFSWLLNVYHNTVVL